MFIFKSCWVCPGISALFPGISAQKNRHIFMQSRAKSAQKVRNPKLTTWVKKWPFPAPSQEIRPKGRNLANGQLFVSFRRLYISMHIIFYIICFYHICIYIYIYCTHIYVYIYMCMYISICVYIYVHIACQKHCKASMLGQLTTSHKFPCLKTLHWLRTGFLLAA